MSEVTAYCWCIMESSSWSEEEATQIIAVVAAWKVWERKKRKKRLFKNSIIIFFCKWKNFKHNKQKEKKKKTDQKYILGYIFVSKKYKLIDMSKSKVCYENVRQNLI